MEKRAKIVSDISLGVFFGAFVITLILFFFSKIQPRNLYYFPLYNSDKIYVESRRCQTKISEPMLNYYVDDLILGPMTNRYKPLFSSKTSVEFCYTQGRTAYIGLSEGALHVNSQVCTLEEGLKLLRLNIVKNFTNINKICIYIDGHLVFEC